VVFGLPLSSQRREFLRLSQVTLANVVGAGAFFELYSIERNKFRVLPLVVRLRSYNWDGAGGKNDQNVLFYSSRF